VKWFLLGAMCRFIGLVFNSFLPQKKIYKNRILFLDVPSKFSNVPLVARVPYVRHPWFRSISVETQL